MIYQLEKQVSEMMDERFLQAIRCSNQSRPPVWLMRQAGRHMAAYRNLRQKYSFLQLCHNPELIAKTTLLPIQAYEVDAAILFSDILVVAEAMGVGLHFEDQTGPLIERPIISRKDIDSLPEPDTEKLQYVAQGIKLLKTQLKIPLIGFCGAPFTIASYMIEGKTSRDHKKTKKWMQADPEGFHALLKKITDWSVAYLNLQIDAGVDALQIFDSWANTLSHYSFREFSLAYMKKIVETIGKDQVPMILFCRGSSVFAPQLAEIFPAAIGLDWNCQMSSMRNIIPNSIALQGNLDPDTLYAPIPKLKLEVERLLDEMSGDPGFIFNLGHGIAPDVTEEAVRTLVECVKNR